MDPNFERLLSAYVREERLDAIAPYKNWDAETIQDIDAERNCAKDNLIRYLDNCDRRTDKLDDLVEEIAEKYWDQLSPEIQDRIVNVT